MRSAPPEIHQKHADVHPPAASRAAPGAPDVRRAGALLCEVGLIVAVPVVLIGSAYTYKTLTGQPVAP